MKWVEAILYAVVIAGGFCAMTVMAVLFGPVCVGAWMVERRFSDQGAK